MPAGPLNLRRTALTWAIVWLSLLVELVPATAQRVIFPSAAPDPSGLYYSTPASSYGAAPSYGVAQAPSIYSTPYNPTAPGGYLPPAGSVPGVSAWDPYADPGSLAAPSLTAPPAYPTVPYGANPYAPNPYGANPYYGNPYAQPSPFGAVEGYYREAIRLMQNVRAQHTWIAGDGGNDFDVNVLELSATFGIPAGQIQQPILITPHFNFNWWQGPDSIPAPTPPRDLPSRVYDAYLETAWRPQFTPIFGADLSVSVGVYSDFQYTDSNSLRVTGRGVGLVTLTPNAVFAMGVWYLNRDRVKLLPAGGFIWNPNGDTRYEILFPNPKLAHRLFTRGVSNYWGYISGEYGGGQWTIKHDDGSTDVVNYNDMRLYLGIENISATRLRGDMSVGYVFNREILYRNGTPNVNPGDSVLLRFGLQY